MRLVKLFILSLLAVQLSGCLFAIRKLAQPAVVQLKVGGDTRRYLLHVPKSYQSSKPVPLVLVLHGGGGNGRNAESMTGFTGIAEEEGFLVAYPFGWGAFDEKLLTWNAGNCCGKAMADKKDDVAFIRAVIERIKQEYAVDTSRIYATGMSNGGMMTHRLACEAGDVFAGVSPVAGALNFDACRPTRSMPMVIFHGRADQHVLYEGGQTRKSVGGENRLDASVAFAVNFWKKQNGCEEEPTITKTGMVEHARYSCTNAALDLYSIDDEGHTWPGGEKGRITADEPTREISASRVMWKFWSQNQRVR